MTAFRAAVLVGLPLAAALAWALVPGPVSAAAVDLDGVSVVTTANGLGFVDSRSGDVWLHAFQPDGSLRVQHLRVGNRGATLQLLTDTK